MQKFTISIMENITVEFESASVAELITKAAFWSELPKVCPLCKAPVVFFYRNPKDNDYYGLHCTGPRPHETNFGQFKDVTKGFFYRGTSSWTESIVKWDTPGEQSGQQTNGASAGNYPEPPRPEDIERPVASNLGELITFKQLGMVKALARDLMIDVDEECNKVMRCRADELSKTAASAFIKHLQEMQKARPTGGPPPPAPNPTPPAAPAVRTDEANTQPAKPLSSYDDDIPF